MDRGPEFDGLVLKSIPTLRRFAKKLCGNLDQAEDLISETVAKALVAHDTFAAGSNMQAWLTVIARNLHYSRLRRAKREVSDPDGLIAAAVPLPEGQTSAADLRTVARRLRRLPRPMRDALLMVVGGDTYDEVAEALGVEVGTIKSRVFRARAYLAGEQPDVPDETPDRRADIASLLDSGMSVRDVAASLGMTPGAVFSLAGRKARP